MEEWDWDLQAVVRGCRGRSTAAARDPLSSFSPSLLILQEQDGFAFQGRDEERGHGRDIFCFPNLLGPTESSTEELVKLYRPFFPKLSSSCLASSPPPLQKTQIQQWQSTRSPSAVSLLQTGGFTPAKQEQQRPPVSTQVTPTTTRSKRRKNQQKRVVCRVPADGLSHDMWAWRKYGQKPIKGSPYPRGYYRCSSSKGCLARKQVEICRTDPGVFVITYTAEHNHPVPTHRNSLAGSIRHKFPQSNSTSSTTTKDYNDNQVNCGQMGENIVLTSSNPMSPTTPLTSSMGEEDLLHPMKKEGGGEEVEEEEEEDEEGMLLVTDMEMLGEDDVVFLGLEDLKQSSPGDHFPSNWRTVTTTGET